MRDATAIDQVAEKNQIEFVLIDLSPSLGALNQNLLMSSDAFIIPMAPDFFSGMVLRSLSSVLPLWSRWSASAGKTDALRNADYPWLGSLPKYLGSIVQNYRRRSRGGGEARPTRAFEKWFKDLNDIMKNTFLSALRDADLLMAQKIYDDADSPPEKFLLEVPDFNSLIAISQDLSKPVFTLTLRDIKAGGSVAQNQLASMDSFNKIYGDGAHKLLKLLQGV